MSRIFKLTLPVLLCWPVGSQSALVGGDEPVSFSRDIQPLLARNCFACHGPDEAHREADLRLDEREVALELGALVPGEPDESELVRRIFSDDPDERMPPADSKHSLTDEQKLLLRRWVSEGAPYTRHWAFVPPVRPDVPAVRDQTWPHNAIDNFVLARLDSEGVKPSPPADRYTLVRRVYLDLIGLPPTPEESDAVVNDDDPLAYEKLVDRLLESPHYGEHWARKWLDLARYSDTNGYEKDRPRSIWPYRDWVIRALNDDMPFDQFTIEQLAGDMLPDATPDQRIATGFHRNTMLNEEGGIDPLEYRFYAMVDRVATTGTVWLGLTTGCAQCHTHKYDPITHTDYYGLMALLNNADEPDLAVPDSSIAQQRREFEEQIAKLEADLPNQFPPGGGDEPIKQRRAKNFETQFSGWFAKQTKQAVDWRVLRPNRLETNLPKLEVLEDGSIFSSGDITKRDVFHLGFQMPDLGQADAPRTALRLEVLPDERLPAHGPGRAYYEGRKGDFFLSELSVRVNGEPAKINAASHSYGKISIGSGDAQAENVFDGDGSTGWSTSGREGERHALVVNLNRSVAAGDGIDIEMTFERHFAASLGRFRFSVARSTEPIPASPLPERIETILVARSGDRPQRENDEQMAELRRYFLSVAPQLAEARKPIDQLRSQLPAFAETMVMQERPGDNPRETFRHHRGEYLSPREEVAAAIPLEFRRDDQPSPRNRLEFARWLASRSNPLIGRVAVNRAWRAFFGHGLVRTSGDFGTQSEPPTHPELLDWLTVEFIEQGWSLKKLHRRIVLSATYRQSSIVHSNNRQSPSANRQSTDPANRLLARGPRVRVDAETVRDIMLGASGLLAPQIGGPSVYPPQPESVTALAYGNTAWPVSTGEDRYRRSLYTFSKRTAPFAAYTVFDGPTGEICAARRDRSNTPLQALTLLNDEMFLEFARALAQRVTSYVERPTSNAERPTSKELIATEMFRRLLTRPPTEAELSALVAFHDTQQARLESAERDAALILAWDAKASPTGKQRLAAQAAWVMVARAIVNLDEVITKE